LNNSFSKAAVWLVVALVLFTVFKQFEGQQTRSNEMTYSEFMQDAQNGRIKSAVVEGRTVRAVTTDDRERIVHSPGDIWMVGDLLKYGVQVRAKPEEEPSLLMSLFVSWFPMLLLIGVWVFFMRQMQGGGKGGAFSFGKSRAKLLDENTNPVTFADVAGCDEAKEDVQEMVDFLKDPSRFQKLGGRIPRGVLMWVHPVQVKPCLRKQLRVRRRSRFSRFLVPISLRCSWVWALPVFAICSSRPKSRHLALFSLMKLMRWVASAAQLWAAAMTNVSKHLTRCWSKWTGFQRTRPSS